MWSLDETAFFLSASISNPRFIETVPRKGLRFIATVERLEPVRSSPSAEQVDPGFVGRKALLKTTLLLLSEGRLVTLLGPGGSGKTRLARHIALRLQSEQDDTFFCALADARDRAADRGDCHRVRGWCTCHRS